MKKILVDSNIFIFANIREYPEHDMAKERIKQLIDDAIIAQHAIDLNVDGIFTDNVKDFENRLELKIIPLRS